MKERREKQCYDGYLVKSPDALTLLQPYILPRRTDSQVMLNFMIDLTPVNEFLKKYKQEIPGLTLYHVVFACIIRAAFTYPQINRFIAGHKVYQRRHVRISMMVKKELSIHGEETSIFPTFEATDTLADIVAKTNAAAAEALAENTEDNGGFNKLVGILEKVPAPLLQVFVNFMLYLDRQGHLPKALVDVQPFHSSFFITNVGSIGLPVVYHHLYEFGTCSGFAALGSKQTLSKLKPDGSVYTYRALPLKMCIDSRICDGYTWASACKVMKRCFAHPELLLEGYQPKESQKTAGNQEPA